MLDPSSSMGAIPVETEDFFFASNEPKSVLARDLGDCRENLENSQSEFSKSSVSYPFEYGWTAGTGIRDIPV